MDEDSKPKEDREPSTLIMVIAGAAFALLLCLGAAGYFVFQTWAPPAPSGQPSMRAPIANSTAAPGGSGRSSQPANSAMSPKYPEVAQETLALPGVLPGGITPPRSDKILRRVRVKELAAIGELYSGGKREDLLSIEWSRLLPPSHAVAVPEGTVLKFRAEWDVTDLSALGRLNAGDLDAVDLRRASLDAKSLAAIGNLSGLRALRLEGPGIDDRAMSIMPKLNSLEILEMRDCPVTDKGMESLAKLSRLRVLSMRGANITGAGLRTLGRLNRLIHLDIVDTKLVNEDLAGLTALPGLVDLRLVDTRITDDGLVWFKKLRLLRGLWISDARIRGSGLVHLRNLPLERLSLSDTYLDDAGATNISAMKRLFRLYLGETKITDRTIPTLLNVPSLRALNLAHTLLTDAGALQLAGLKNLKLLNLPAQITASARGKLQKQLPECRIDQKDQWPFD